MSTIRKTKPPVVMAPPVLSTIASKHNIPEATLRGYVKEGHRQASQIPFSGPPAYLSANEEKQLCAFLIECGDRGFPLTQDDISALVFEWLLTCGVLTSVHRRTVYSTTGQEREITKGYSAGGQAVKEAKNKEGQGCETRSQTQESKAERR